MAPLTGQELDPICKAAVSNLRDFLISLDRNASKSLQAQLREVLVTAILAGHMRPGDKLPSTRHLSRQLGISRNTSVLVYQGLKDDGYLRTSERSGYFVNETVLEMGIHSSAGTRDALQSDVGAKPVDWASKLLKKPANQRNIQAGQDFSPTISVTTRSKGDKNNEGNYDFVIHSYSPSR